MTAAERPTCRAQRENPRRSPHAEPLLADEFEQLVVAHHELFILRIHQIVLLEIFPHLFRQLCSVDGLLSA